MPTETLEKAKASKMPTPPNLPMVLPSYSNPEPDYLNEPTCQQQNHCYRPAHLLFSHPCTSANLPTDCSCTMAPYHLFTALTNTECHLKVLSLASPTISRICRTHARSYTSGVSLNYGDNLGACHELHRFLWSLHKSPTWCLQKGVTGGARILKRENTRDYQYPNNICIPWGSLTVLFLLNVYQYKKSKCSKWWLLSITRESFKEHHFQWQQNRVSISP